MTKNGEKEEGTKNGQKGRKTIEIEIARVIVGRLRQ
jgi:hypothetical protein